MKKDFDGESRIVLKVPAIRCGCKAETSKNYLKITPELQTEKQIEDHTELQIIPQLQDEKQIVD